MQNYRLERSHTALLIVDVQESLFPLVERRGEVLETILKTIKGFQALRLPIYVTEQYPAGLKKTIPPIREILGDKQEYWEKTSFSCMGDKAIEEHIKSLPISQWVVVGIEAHVCILQSVKDLLSNGQRVVVLNDAIASRSIYDYSTAIAEMRDNGARISSCETVLFELVGNSKDPDFKKISDLIKVSGEQRSGCGCC